MDPLEREALEAVMLQSVIEASLVEVNDDIIEIDLCAALVPLKPIFDVDE